jgi:hypothetical protein
VSNLAISSLTIFGDPLEFFRGLFHGCGDMYDERESLIKQVLCGQCSIKLIEVLPSRKPCVAKTNIHMFFYYGNGMFHAGRDVCHKVVLGDNHQVLCGKWFSLEVKEGDILKGIAIYQKIDNARKKDPRYFASK